jgi:hypothetical protein
MCNQLPHGEWNPIEKCFLTTYHPSFIMRWWVPVHCGGELLASSNDILRPSDNTLLQEEESFHVWLMQIPIYDNSSINIFKQLQHMPPTI